MREIGDMKLYNFEELLEEDFGPIGTPERDKFEESVDKHFRAHKLVDCRQMLVEGHKF